MDEPARALTILYRTIAVADAHRQGVNADAMAHMHLYRTCALYALGRGAEAASSLALANRVTTVSSAVYLRFCIGDDAGARQEMLRALADDRRRDQAIAALQKPTSPPMKSRYAEQTQKKWEALSKDPRILTELAKYGRLLPFRLNEEAQFAPEPKAREPEHQSPNPVT